VKIDLVVGARPNFVKAAAILHAAKKFPQITFRFIHLGQHKGIMSDPYFKDLELPEPDVIGDYASTYVAPAVRLAEMMRCAYNYWAHDKADYVMVVGDTDSTLAGALAAAKSGIPVIHVEAGMRCGDMKMQEEINRILVDSIAAKHYASSHEACRNLRREGHTDSVKMVGNVMVDTLSRLLPRALMKYPPRLNDYAVFTLHRAENVDNSEKLNHIIAAVEQVAEKIPVIWPVHPRLGPLIAGRNIRAVEPMGYLEFIFALKGAKFVMTDSGGVQEETTALGVPCLTLRENTERPETVSQGTNRVIGTDPRYIVEFANASLRNDHKFERRRPDGYDGHAAERILEDLCAI
jgi:UDP-N-acetylglucosamine 2-epimerase (non-hydrolysing)